MRLGHLELITLLNFCSGGQPLRAVKEKCPHFWSSLSGFGHATGLLGLSTMNWWKERYLFPYVVSELLSYLPLIANRSFSYRDERQLELVWQAISTNCSNNQQFFTQVISAFPQIEELVQAPFPKFSLVRAPYQKNRIRRGFQSHAQAHSWLDNETLNEYETRVARIPGKNERDEEEEEPESITPVRQTTLKQFRSLQVKSSQLEKETERQKISVQQMVSDAVTVRFEDIQLFLDIENFAERYARILVLVGTLHLDTQEIEIGQRLMDEEQASNIIAALESRLSELRHVFEEWKKEKNDLLDALKRLFDDLQARIQQLYSEIEERAKLEIANSHKQIFQDHVRNSKNITQDYEMSLIRPPGPSFCIQNVEEIVNGNLQFLEKLQHYLPVSTKTGEQIKNLLDNRA